ncbi:serine/threonine protein kinase [Chloropicon primus]|uniref:non-specific serine/threonine protein kinase n=1 Tax=Chloropicon primus TaxID=1764295 RepID=A0A5B8MVJ9_9CHLO|nr:serine/threonine protein kinase [Chloropicon primus]UPR04037.1 serine/threonine protein kinase [Chloropicon primus]|eukprot:QDZ24828.1 serine/threonine protein kinase [Chloropicon primus]
MANRNLQWQQNQVSTRKKGLANYKIIREVESSPYQLFKARRIVDRLFCIIKRIDLSNLTEEEKLLSFNEVKVLASLKCQYIVTCYDSFTEGNSLYVVVEYTHMGSLKKKLANQRGKLLGERSVWKYFLQIAAAVLNMNQNSILHGSLQPQSIFLNSKDDIRLSNFGRAIRLSRSSHQRDSHRARRKKGLTYNTKTEMLSLGYLLYELCTLKSVNDSKQHSNNLSGMGLGAVNGTNQANGKVSYNDLAPISHGYSPELETLVKDLLSSDPSQRPSIQEVWTSPLVRNKALNSNVQMPKVFFPQLQVLNEMKNKYSSAKGGRHWSRIGGQEKNSRGMGRNNFPLADAIRQIKWDNAGGHGAAGGFELHDYNDQLHELQYGSYHHPINGDINYRGNRGKGQDNGRYNLRGSMNGDGNIHAQDLRTKVESDWIGQKRGSINPSSHGAQHMGSHMGSEGSNKGPITAIMRKGNGYPPTGKGVTSPKGSKPGNRNQGRRRLKDELDNWMASKENDSRHSQMMPGGANGVSKDNRSKERLGKRTDLLNNMMPDYGRRKREMENEKLDWCLKFLVMGPIGPWSDNDDLVKNEFNDYVARSIQYT